MSVDLFEKASRLKLRFNTPKGLVTAEDLWDLPLNSRAGHANLDDLAKELNRAIKAESSEVSFVDTASSARASSTQADVLETKFEIVKRVIQIKVEERDQVERARTKAAQKQRIMEIIDRKQNEQLEESSIEDLHKMLGDL